jgi:hypothetical protein
MQTARFHKIQYLFAVGAAVKVAVVYQEAEVVMVAAKFLMALFRMSSPSEFSSQRRNLGHRTILTWSMVYQIEAGAPLCRNIESSHQSWDIEKVSWPFHDNSLQHTVTLVDWEKVGMLGESEEWEEAVVGTDTEGAMLS